MLLTDPDQSIQQVGAEALRDLRAPSTTNAIAGALDDAQLDDLIAVLAHTLAMLQTPDTAPLLNAKAKSTSNATLADLLRLWAAQLDQTN